MKKVFLWRDRNAFNRKWICDFGSKLDEIGYDVSIVCDDKKHDPDDDEPVSDNVKKINLRKRFTLLSSINIYNFVKKERPDVVFAYFMRDLLKLSLSFNMTKVITMFHNSPIEVFKKFNFIERFIFKRLLRKTTIQVLMPEFIQPVKNFVGNVEVTVIPNLVKHKITEKLSGQHSKTIIHVARVAEVSKRQHLLIEAFSKIAYKYPDWKVYFFGMVKKGKHMRYYNKCLARIKELDLGSQIVFKGHTKNITQAYLDSDICTLPSSAEGFGLGLADGMALGLPGIGFADAAAVNQIIVHDKSGFLVTDVSDYANKLDVLMSDQALRQSMGQYARKDMQARYSPDIVMGMWKSLIEKVLDEVKD